MKSTIELVYPGYGWGSIGDVYCPGVHSGEEEEEYYGRKKFDLKQRRMVGYLQNIPIDISLWVSLGSLNSGIRVPQPWSWSVVPWACQESSLGPRLVARTVAHFVL